MKNAVDVRPRKWSNIIVLFDDGIYSVIWGNYADSKNRHLGVRWNGDTETSVGFPSTRGKPQWHLEPRFLHKPILTELTTKLAKEYDEGNISMQVYVKRLNYTLKAISELTLTNIDTNKDVCHETRSLGEAIKAD